MALHVYEPLTTGLTYNLAVRRAADKLYWDFSGLTFTSTPATKLQAVTEDPAGSGVFTLIYGTTPVNQWIDGDYVLEFYQSGVAQAVSISRASMFAGDDSPVNFPLLHAGIARGGTNNTVILDANASTSSNAYSSAVVAITAGTGAGQAGIVSSYNGGTQTVTIAGTFNPVPDSTSVVSVVPLGASGGGVAGVLASNGVDAIIVAQNAGATQTINLRQAVNLILSSLANLDESNGNSSVFKDALLPTTARITTTRTSTGRSNTVFSPPA